MSYSRQIQPQALLQGDDLARSLVGIGFLLACPARSNPPIEDTLLAASIEGMERDDLRVLALLTTWLEEHHPWVNADRLVRLASASVHPRTRAYWAAIGQWLGSDRRFLRLQDLQGGRRTKLLRVGTTFQIGRRGEDARFDQSPLRVPAGVLRDRAGDVLTPSELAAKHHVYRQRIRIGPGYRADMWALLELEPHLTAADLARRAYGSYATAWRVRRDFDVLAGSGVTSATVVAG